MYIEVEQAEPTYRQCTPWLYCNKSHVLPVIKGMVRQKRQRTRIRRPPSVSNLRGDLHRVLRPSYRRARTEESVIATKGLTTRHAVRCSIIGSYPFLIKFLIDLLNNVRKWVCPLIFLSL